jgi:SulP family sulfate permease
VGFSLLAFIYRSANPRIVELGRVEGTDHLFRDVRNYAASTRTDPSVAILRMDAPLYFANAHFLADRVEALVAARPRLRHVLVNAASWNDVDADGARTLRSLYEALKEAGVGLHLVTLRGYARDVLGRAGLFQMLLDDRRLWSDAAEALEAIDLPPDSPLRRDAASESRPQRVF